MPSSLVLRRVAHCTARYRPTGHHAAHHPAGWRHAAAALLVAAVALQPLLAGAEPARTQPTPAEPGRTESGRGQLPPDVEAALAAARLPREALSLVVQDVAGAQARWSWQADRALNPASLMKLLPTYAALELLGPTHTWTTPIWLTGPVRAGVLEGSLVIKGQGDPRLVSERLWLLMRRLQQMGVREIRGDIVLDRSAFGIVEVPPGDFDGEPFRPYNAGADALLLNFRSVVLTFLPDLATGRAAVTVEPTLAGVEVPTSVPLVVGGAASCGDWRTGLRADFSQPTRWVLAGSFPAACGERHWPVAPPDPAGYNARLIEALWRGAGGQLSGRVRDGLSPDTPPSFELTSPTLAEVVRDINKFSNNVMAQQLFLSLAFQPGQAATVPAAREALTRWATQRAGDAARGLVVDNGSGLSRDSRASAGLLARLLLHAWASPVMPEFVASLPLAGADGTSRRMRGVEGRAHLKTGSLRDVAAVAGYVHAASGRRYAVVAIVNHPNASAARPAFERLIQLLANDVSAAPPASPSDRRPDPPQNTEAAPNANASPPESRQP
jgi:serine-type D-Ala-D-Ala carboxypeptidase/endopeptidase (penicillin-binding protein 4)